MATVFACVISLASLAMSIYTVFLRRPKLQAEVEAAHVSSRQEGLFQFMISLHITSINGDIWIRSIHLAHRDPVVEFEDRSLKRRVELGGAYAGIGPEVLDQPRSDIKKSLDALPRQNIQGSQIRQGESRTMAFIGGISTETYSDSSAEMPVDGWSVVIRTGIGQTYTLPVSFVLRPGADKSNFRFD